jgi:hypothetical protein
MSRVKPERSDELRREYDFSELRGGVRGKYLRRYRAGTNLALLEPDVAAAFPTDEAVNEALRTVLRAATAMRRVRRPSNKALQRSVGAGKVSDEPTAKRRAARR